MTEHRDGVLLRRLPTGVPGLDDVGGGLPELSFNLIAGGPGSCKTTLVHQIMFANATPERPGLYFTILGEPPLKMLRYQQLYTFFDPAKVNGTIRFVSLSDAVIQQGVAAVLDRIVQQVEAASPGIVVVDSFRSGCGTIDGQDARTLRWRISCSASHSISPHGRPRRSCSASLRTPRPRTIPSTRLPTVSLRSLNGWSATPSYGNSRS